MRKLRDYDAELKALADKARQLKSRKQSQLGELVIATGADELSSEQQPCNSPFPYDRWI